jgi:hypothetical protein
MHYGMIKLLMSKAWREHLTSQGYRQRGGSCRSRLGGSIVTTDIHPKIGDVQYGELMMGAAGADYVLYVAMVTW